ncbi:hypothetical protein B484DRAFT_408247 [Ochromonadaceae sp. CCMP2298]|nr:hypothetical protein B484DRAFT_408247 [Ochromonadaceae sp. CCMP2298]
MPVLVNSGNSRGEDVISDKPPGGLYSISGMQPLLQSSKAYIMGCWNECGRISQLTGWQYNCSETLYTTTADMQALESGFRKTVSEEQNDAMHGEAMQKINDEWGGQRLTS